MNKHLKNLSVSNEHFQQELFQAMAERTIYINVHWTKGGPLKFHKVSWKIPGGKPTSAIATTLTNTTGFASFPIGSFPSGTAITVNCSLEAFADIPRAVVIIIQDNPNTELSREPIATFKAIANGEYWKPTVLADTQ